MERLLEACTLACTLGASLAWSESCFWGSRSLEYYSDLVGYKVILVISMLCSVCECVLSHV